MFLELDAYQLQYYCKLKLSALFKKRFIQFESYTFSASLEKAASECI